MRREPGSLLDGFSVIQRGVNSGLAPVSLGRDELSWAVNATFRNNYAATRPGFQRRLLVFSGDAQSNFQDGIFQGAVAFQRMNQLVAMIGGHVFSITLDNWDVIDIGAPNTANASNRYRAWFVEAEQFVIAQDGQSAPIIYDGSASRRSDTFGIGGVQEVPVGTAMCYGGGRLVVASPDGQRFVVGDIVGGPSGTVQYNYRDAILKFTENNLLAGGGSFSVPINAGPITAIHPVSQIDTSTGQGPTQIITTNAVFSLNTPTDRTTWATVEFPLQTVSLVQAGGLSDRGTVNVNGDFWTRSYDGIRSFKAARSKFNQDWSNAPMSQEMVRVLSRDDPYLLEYGSAAVFDNRLLMTIQPYRNWGHGIAHRGLAVLDFAPSAYLNDRATPIWEGIWTGLQFLQVLTGTFGGQERCFAFALSASNQVELWELTRDASADNNGSFDVPIEWVLESGGLTFPTVPGSESVPPQNLLSLIGGKLYADSLEDTVAFTALYRMDQDPCWRPWHQWSVCATQLSCPLPTDGCFVPRSYQPQFRKPFFLPRPANASDSVTNRNLNWGREAQARLIITGHARVKRFEATAHAEQEDVTNTPAGNETCVGEACDACVDDFSYSITPVIT